MVPIYSDNDMKKIRKSLVKISDYSEWLLDKMISNKEDLTTFVDDKDLKALKLSHSKLVSKLVPISYKNFN